MGQCHGDAGLGGDAADADDGGVAGSARKGRDPACLAGAPRGDLGRADQPWRLVLLVLGLYPAECRLRQGAWSDRIAVVAAGVGAVLQGGHHPARDPWHGVADPVDPGAVAGDLSWQAQPSLGIG